jgi:hypothetical protein
MAKVNPIQLAKSLKGVNYPADKAEVMKAAKGNDAPEAIIELLGQLEDQTFARPTDVSKAVKELD